MLFTQLIPELRDDHVQKEGVVVGGVVVALIAAAFPIEKYFWKGNFAEILLVIYH